MAKADEVLHKKIASGLADTRVSPAVLANYMLNESLYVNESLVQYMVNYIITLATRPHVPLHLESVHVAAKNLYCSLQELGLTGTIGRESAANTEYLAV
jgi:hypothetical protein